MKSLMAVPCALFMALAMSSAALASPMDSIAWQPFSGSWSENNSNGTATIGSTITLSPSSPDGDVSITTTSSNYLISQGSSFALKVPFSIASTGMPGAGGDEAFDIVFQNDTIWSTVIWAAANNLTLGGNVYDGTFFAEQQNADTNPLAIQNSTVTSGELGLIYSGNTITTYYNDASGWRQIGLTNSTLGSSGSLVFELEAQGGSSNPFTVTIPDVWVGNPAATVPEPGTIFILGFGLVALATCRRQGHSAAQRMGLT